MADDSQVIAERERIFKHFDANGDGKVSAAELGDALSNVSSVTTDEVTRMMSKIDTDGDGFISYQEFMAFASANPEMLKDVARIVKI
ncbi:polcalcin Ole e 3 [Juglans regia]|uniref:Polcalcin Ole e 3 n=2 Tax=Juglans regia TaxID=51240 RepID=A0A2I4EC28_JUGRE|nr:polcalcin Ole e 3 [Juglans regia]